MPSWFEEHGFTAPSTQGGWFAEHGFSPPSPTPTIADSLITSGLRIAPAIIGGVAGTAVAPGIGTAAGGALGSGLGEVLAEWYEREHGQRPDLSLPQIGVQTTLGAVGMKPLAAGAGLARRLLTRAGQGAGLAGAASVATPVIETGTPPPLQNVLTAAGTGAALGGLFGGIEHRLARPAPSPASSQISPPGAQQAVTPPISPELPSLPGQMQGRSSVAPLVAPPIPPSLSPRGPLSGFQRSAQPLPPSQRIPADRLMTIPKLPKDLQEDALRIMEKYGGFEEQRRGVQPVVRTEALSDRLPLPPLNLPPGTALNAEQLRRYGNVSTTLLNKQHALEAAVKQGTASPAQLLDLEVTKGEAATMLASFRGASAEAGRALNILRYQTRILASGDQAAMEEALRVQPGSPLRDYFYANILSGLKTQERNILGSVSNIAFRTAAHPVTVGLDVIKASLYGRPREVFLAEMPERAVGMFTAVPRASQAFLSRLLHNRGRTSLSTFDYPVRTEFSGVLRPLNYVGRTLDAVDEFFGEIVRQGELYGRAFAEAKKAGLQGTAFLDAVASLKANPTQEMIDAAIKASTRTLFREKPGAFGRGLLALKQSFPQADFIIPFVRVPANIVRQGFEASPAGFAMKAVRQAGRAGTEAQGSAATGSLLLLPLAYYASLGRITGDVPSDPGQRAAFYESGKIPNGILIGGKWRSYQNLQPLNIPLSLVANAFQTWRDQKGEVPVDALILETVRRSGRSMLDQSFLSGVSSLVEAFSRESGTFLDRWASQFATGFIPLSGLLRDIAQATDPIIRDPSGPIESIRSNIPGLSTSLPPRLTRFGEPIKRTASPFNVFRTTPEVHDPIAEALARVGITLQPASGPSTLNIGPEEVPLSRTEQTSAGQLSGRSIRAGLEALLREVPDLDHLPRDVQERLLRQRIDQARDVARMQTTLQKLGILSP